MQIFQGFAENWDNICVSDFGGLCCAPGMESRRYMVQEYPESWMAHEGYCKDQGGALVAFETRAEMDCIIQYMEDKFPVDRYPFSWAIGLASSFRYKGVIFFTDANSFVSSYRSSRDALVFLSITPSVKSCQVCLRALFLYLWV